MPALDGVRGIAILLVMIFHFAIGPARPDAWIERGYLAIAEAGWIGVSVFFVLSGFLITGILYDAKGSDGYFRRFWARRALRIFPLYFGFLVVRLLVLPLLLPDRAWMAAKPGAWSLWTYTANMWIAFQQSYRAVPPLTGHFWSLAVEEQFYLLWPLFVFSLPRRALLRVCGAAIVVATLTRITLAVGMGNVFAAYMLMPARMGSLAVGAAVALLVRSPDGRAWLRRWTPLVVAAAAAIVVGLHLWRHGFDAYDPWVQICGYLPVACLAGGLVFRAVDAPASRLTRIVAAPWLRWLGRYSYGLYVFHVPLAHLLHRLVPAEGVLPAVAGSMLPARLGVALLAGLASAALALASYHLMEARFLALKRYFPSGRAVASAPSAV